MVDLQNLSRRWWALVICGGGLCISEGVAQSAPISSRWWGFFPAMAGVQGHESTAVPVSDRSTMVVIVAAGHDPMSLKLKVGDQPIPFKAIGHDPVSTLGFIKVVGDVVPDTTVWVENVGANSRAVLQYSGPGGQQQCRTSGWIKEVNGKVLPLSLLHVSFNGKVPPPGTPLTDSAGRVVGIMFQGSGAGNIGYAIPAEAVRRVQQDICNGGYLTRGWLGLALRAESPTPKICRVLSDSPADAAGIKPGDLLLGIGARQVSDYADAANAFFYLIPGEPVRVKLRRGADELEFMLTPTLPNS